MGMTTLALIVALLAPPSVEALNALGKVETHDGAKALVLTPAEHATLMAAVARGVEAERQLTEAKAKLAGALREAAACEEGKALVSQVRMPVCECAEWTYGLAGLGAGALACGALQIGDVW